MVRLFDRHTKRKVFNLDGMWKFKTDPEKKGVSEQWFINFPQDCSDMIVPSCWNNELGLYDYEGVAWYSTQFTTTSENINLVFHAVTGQAEVYLDGEHLGGHYGGFTGFNFLVRSLAPGQHTLTLSVDSTHDDLNTIPLARVDWYHYGGIPRSIEVMELGEVYIKDVRIDYQLDRDLKNAELGVKVTLENLSAETLQKELKITVDGVELCSPVNAGTGTTTIEIGKISLKDIKLWDIFQPNLYTVCLDIGNDDRFERIGFRKIDVKEKKLLLNGREIYIKGVNRHEDHPDWGFAFPFKLMKKDIEIIKNLGCNSIRGSHYPNSELFLDYMDQEGLLFWEEIPMWGYPEEPLKNPLILERGLMMHEEMVKRDYHHPCIILWGMHNEIDTRIQAGYDITKAFAEKVRSLDPSRPITYATMYPLEDICYSLVDIVSINQYFGWYYKEIEDWGQFLTDMQVKLKRDGLSHMPIIMSEFGAAAMFGDSTFESPKWTENYQEKLLDHTLKLFHKDPTVVGSYIWQFCDMRTAKELALGRARSFNNKGILNEYRKPKLAYWTVKKIYEGIK